MPNSSECSQLYHVRPLHAASHMHVCLLEHFLLESNTADAPHVQRPQCTTRSVVTVTNRKSLGLNETRAQVMEPVCHESGPTDSYCSRYGCHALKMLCPRVIFLCFAASYSLQGRERSAPGMCVGMCVGWVGAWVAVPQCHGVCVQEPVRGCRWLRGWAGGGLHGRLEGWLGN